MASTKAYDLHTARLSREPTFDPKDVGPSKLIVADEIELFDLVTYARGQVMFVQKMKRRGTLLDLSGTHRDGHEVKCTVLRTNLYRVRRIKP